MLKLLKHFYHLCAKAGVTSVDLYIKSIGLGSSIMYISNKIVILSRVSHIEKKMGDAPMCMRNIR